MPTGRQPAPGPDSSAARPSQESESQQQQDLGSSPGRGFVLPPLPSVAPTAFQLPSQQEPEADTVSTSSSDEVAEKRQRARARARALQAAASSSTASSQTSPSSSQEGNSGALAEAVPAPQPSANQARETATQRASTSAQDPSMCVSQGRDPQAAARAGSSSSTPRNPLLPSVWGRDGRLSPDLVRSYSSCSVVWAILDSEGAVGAFPAAVQLLWWHKLHRLVDLIVKHADLCQADGGQRGFCIMSGVHGGEPSSNSQASLECALKLMAAARQVCLPNTEPVTVRIGIHFGPAADGLVGAARTLHYQMVGPTVRTAQRLAEYASANELLVSDVLWRHLSAAAGTSQSLADEFRLQGPVPLTRSQEIQTHAFSGPLPEVREDVQQLLDSWRAQTAAVAASFGAAPLGGSASYAEAPVQPAAGRGKQEIKEEDEASCSQRLHADDEEAEDASCSKLHRPHQDSKEKELARGLAFDKYSERLAWQQETFEEMYARQHRRVGQLGNLFLTAWHLLWLCTRTAEPGRSPAATWGPTAAMLLLDALSFLPAAVGFAGQVEARANGGVRVCRVVLLMCMQVSALRAAPATAANWLELVSSFAAPLMTLSLLEGNLMPAHLVADGVCLGLSALLLPPVWFFSGLLSAAVFAATASLGVVLPTVALSNLQQASFKKFVHRTSTDVKMLTDPVGSSGSGLSQKEKLQ